MIRAGLTGGLGSGKSTAAHLFRQLGAHVIEADEVGRQLMEPGQPVYDEIVRHFGQEVLLEDGRLNRKRLATLAFSEGRGEELNRIVHPPVIAAQEEWMRQIFAREPQAVAMVESALIFEAERSGSVPGWRSRFDKIIVITAPEETRIARFVERVSPGKSDPALEADARSRLQAQIPDEEKVRLADYVIRNTGSVDELRRQVEEIYAALRTFSAQQRPA